MMSQDQSDKDMIRLPKIGHKSKSVPGNPKGQHNN